MKRRVIIGISGYATSGKSTVGDILCERHGFDQVAFADALKAGTGILEEGPAFRAVIAGRFRTVERTFAFAPIEAG